MTGTGGGPGQMGEPALRRPAFGHRFVGIMIAELVEGEGDKFEQLLRFGDRLRIVAEQARHFRRGLEKALGIGGEQATRFGDRGLFGDAGKDIVQRAMLRRGIERVIGGEQGDAGGSGKRNQFLQMTLVGTAARHGRAEPDMGGAGAEACNKPLLFREGVGVVARRKPSFGIEPNLGYPTPTPPLKGRG